VARHAVSLILVLFAEFLFATISRAQLDSARTAMPSAPVVSGFAVMGNDITKAEIILRELTLQPGDTVSVEEIEYSKNRIYSLNLFNRVDITWPPMDSTVLLIEVDERWFLYPVPLAGIVDRNWDQWYYGLGVKHENVRGWNEKLFGGFVLGYNPWATVSYSNPWIFGKQHMFMDAGFAWSRVVNKSRISQGEGPNFDEIHYRVNSSIGKRFDNFRSVWITAAWDLVTVSDHQAGRTLSEDGRDSYVSLGIGAKHDTRDLVEYPTEGLFAGASITKKGLGGGSVDMVTTVMDVRAYHLLPYGLSIGLRAFGIVGSGPAIPNYEHAYFGFSERIRGHFHRELEGESAAGMFAELRIPIVPRLYVHVPQVPVRQFRTWKLGLYGAVFTDAGMVWERKDRPTLERMHRGSGVGLHFLFPYGVVFRVDRAWDEEGRGEWILDVGVAF